MRATSRMVAVTISVLVGLAGCSTGDRGGPGGFELTAVEAHGGGPAPEDTLIVTPRYCGDILERFRVEACADADGAVLAASFQLPEPVCPDPQALTATWQPAPEEDALATLDLAVSDPGGCDEPTPVITGAFQLPPGVLDQGADSSPIQVRRSLHGEVYSTEEEPLEFNHDYGAWG